jgi:hypothetical protein
MVKAVRRRSEQSAGVYDAQIHEDVAEVDQQAQV